MVTSVARELNQILSLAEEGVKTLSSLPDYEAYKATLVGPNGSLTHVAKSIGKLPKEDRPTVGKILNEAKIKLEAILDNTLKSLQSSELSKKIGPAIDPTLPSPDAPKGNLHPITKTRRHINDIFRKIGFSIAEGPEVETEWYNFDALNTPDNHPSRDAHDSLYLPPHTQFTNVSRKNAERYLLRTHTSPVQVRTLLEENPPLRIVSPGRVFRRDTVDATHSANFHQIEGLFVDKNVTVKDLKAILDHFVQELFGKDVKTRLRPSFFPFTEPSFELDFFSPNLGKLSNRWVELLGCGIVDPEVLKLANVDPNIWTGFAFGGGIERMAMLLLGIDDLRHFYQNDLRFLKQFS